MCTVMEYSVLFASKLRHSWMWSQLICFVCVCVCVCVSVSNEKVITVVFNVCLLDSDTAYFIAY